MSLKTYWYWLISLITSFHYSSTCRALQTKQIILTFPLYQVVSPRAFEEFQVEVSISKGPSKWIIVWCRALLNEYLNISESFRTRSRCVTRKVFPVSWKTSKCFIKCREDSQHLFDFISGGFAWVLSFPVLLERSACHSDAPLLGCLL